MVGKNLKRTKTFEVETIGLLPTVAKHRQHFLLVSRNRIQSRRHNTCALVNAYCMSVLRIVLTYLKKFTLRPPVILGSTLRGEIEKKRLISPSGLMSTKPFLQNMCLCVSTYSKLICSMLLKRQFLLWMKNETILVSEKSSEYKWARVAYWCFTRCH